MAFAASVSLKDVIERFYYSPDSFVHIHCPESLPFLEYLHEMAKSMRQFDFEKHRRAGGDHLEKQIRDALWRSEDIIESYWLSPLHSSESETNFSQDLLEMVQEINSGMEKMTKFACYDEHGNQDSLSLDDSSPPRCKNEVVGLDELKKLKQIILHDMTQERRLGAAAIHGMGGIGKTTLAISFYNDPDVRNYFCIGAWVEMSLEHCVRDILLSLLRTMEVFDGRMDHEISNCGKIEDNVNEEGLENIVRRRLALERYLVVVDCLCEININSWNYMKSLLPDSSNGSRVILANRWTLPEDGFVFGYLKKPFLDISHSWELLRDQVFGDEPFPHALERIGNRIAENCQGLPLAIITVGFHLAKEEKTVEYWNKIADSGNSIAYDVDGAPMFERLGLSYKQMPQHLRHMFLYLATFPERYETIFSEFMNLMVAEGFVGKEQNINIVESNTEWLLYFISRNLILFDDIDGVFSLHHVLWRLCRELAQKDEFFHVMNMKNGWEDFHLSMNMNNVRRLVVSKNVLLGVKDAFKSKHSVLSSIRSVLLTGPNHLYPLTIRWSMYKMLRVLVARSIRFYEFPVEILSLLLLRYLSLTLNRVEVPPEISRLKNLQFLIVLLGTKVISFGEAPSYLPMEIWEMQQLIHLEVEGSDLPVPPPHSDALLPNLLTLYSISPHSCTKEVLERIPNLIHLLIIINLAPKIDFDSAPVCHFNHLALLQHLEILSCRISNPYFEAHPRPQAISMSETIKVSMNSLTHLRLHGCGLPWKSIKQITRLPALKYLSLQHHAFRGPKWKLSNKRFRTLEFLVLEDLDLVYWTTRSGEFFPCLGKLRIRRCHKLQQIPSGFKRCRRLSFIQVEDSSREAETWALSIRTERSQTGNRFVVVSSPRGATWSTN